MLVIRGAQMACFQSAAERSFEEMAVPTLQAEETAAAAQLSEDDLRRLIRHAIERAPAYGIAEASDVLLLAQLMLRNGPTLEADRWFDQILHNVQLHPTARLRHLLAEKRSA